MKLHPLGGGKNVKIEPEILLGRSWARPKLFFWPPEASEVDFGRLLAPTLRPRGSRTPQNTLRGVIFDDFWMFFEGVFNVFGCCSRVRFSLFFGFGFREMLVAIFLFFKRRGKRRTY